jgi:tetratricopeptide (TPR) repeat protein
MATGLGQPFLDTLRRWLDSGESGAIEWQDGKRRRLVFLNADNIQLIQSNLRSEALDRFTEVGQHADPKRAARQARLSGLLKEVEGTITEHPGAPAPEADPAPVAVCLWEAAAALPEPPLDAYPKVIPAQFVRLAQVPWPAALVNYIAELDGARTCEDVIDFGPEAPETIAWALSLACALGAVELGLAERVAVVRSHGTATTTASGFFELHPPDDPALEDAPPLRSTEPSEPLAQASEPNIEAVRRQILDAKNHFETLGVVWQTTPEVIRKTYLGLAARLHPDRYMAAPAAEREAMATLFDRVREAWEVLGNPESRDEYTRRVVFGEETEEEKAEKRLYAILDAERQLTLAQRELTAQRFPAAHAILKDALAVVPDHPQIQAYAAYALVKMQQGKPSPEVDEATSVIQRVVHDIPTADWAMLLLARTRAARGDFAGAEKATIAVLKLNPSNPDAVSDLRRLRNRKTEQPEKSEPAGKKEGATGFFSSLFKR